MSLTEQEKQHIIIRQALAESDPLEIQLQEKAYKLAEFIAPRVQRASLLQKELAEKQNGNGIAIVPIDYMLDVARNYANESHDKIGNFVSQALSIYRSVTHFNKVLDTGPVKYEDVDPVTGADYGFIFFSFRSGETPRPGEDYCAEMEIHVNGTRREYGHPYPNVVVDSASFTPSGWNFKDNDFRLANLNIVEKTAAFGVFIEALNTALEASLRDHFQFATESSRLASVANTAPPA